jgi:hypothetical protein
VKDQLIQSIIVKRSPQSTLGHANVATTSGYLHARPNTSSGLKLDEGIFR